MDNSICYCSMDYYIIYYKYVWVPQFFLFVFFQHLFSLFISGETVCKLFFLSPSTTFIWSVTNAINQCSDYLVSL